MSKDKIFRIFSVIFALAVLLMSTVGMDALQYHTQSKEAIFSVASYSFELMDDFTAQDTYAAGDVVEHSVAVKNTGSGSLYVRIMAVFENSDVESVCTIDLNTTDYAYKDGYYYLTSPLGAGLTSPALFNTITIASDATLADDFAPNMIIYAETVQIGNYDNYADAWAATLNG